MAKQGRKRKGNFQGGGSLNKAPYKKDDVFEADDSDPEEEKNVGDRYDRVDNFEYELPSDFEDEEIDEDEAFNSEDERMYGHMFANRRRRGGGGGSEEEEEEEEEEESGSEGEGDLLDSGESDSGSGSEEEEDEGYDSELEEAFARAGGGGSEGEEEGGEGSESEGDDAARAAMVEALTGAAGKGARERRRRRDVVVTEAYPESEFNLPAGGPEGELTLTDLIAGLGDGRAKLGAARKALERLERKAAPVAAPLPGPIRDRQERRAGYESAKKDIAKWMPVVKAHREAPTLHFKSDAAAVPRTVTTASLAAKHTPETAMEAEVAALLTAAGAATAAAVAEAEEALAMKSLSVGEAAARREKLAKMRALLFYHEKKAKRMKKIKSKEYRRRAKKAEARKAAAGGAAAGDELALDDEELRRQQEEAEFDRAQERLTLKHRNTSRFIRRALKRGGQDLDDGTKQAVAEQLRLGQELRQRVHRMGGARGSGSDDSGTDASDDESSEEEEGAGGGAGRGQLSAKARAAALEILQGRGGGGDEEAPAEGLFALPFMQRAMARRKAAAAEEARALLELDGGDAAGGADEPGAGGRLKFGGSGDAQRLAERVRAMEAAAAADASDLDGDEREDAEAKAERLARRLRGAEAEEDAAAGGDVLARVTRQQARLSRRDQLFEGGGGGARIASASAPLGSGGISRSGVEVSVGPSSRGGGGGAAAAGDQPPPAFLRSKTFQGAKPGYAFKKGPKGVGYYADKKAAGGGGKLAAAPPPAAQKQQQQQPKPSKKRQQREESSGDEVDEPMRPAGANGAANGAAGRRSDAGLGLSQEELVRRAFAGDDVVAAFAEEKAAEVEAELPAADVPGALPGWGTWAGAKREPRWAVEAKAKAAAAREAAAASRADAGLQYVVISEKWDRRHAKYRTPEVPYPYDSKDTYERAMRQPLGRQFNTDAGFRNLTRPAVVKDAGVIIQPVRYSAAMAQHAREGGGGRRHAVLTVEGGMPKRARLDKNRGGQKGKKRAAGGGGGGGDDE